MTSPALALTSLEAGRWAETTGAARRALAARQPVMSGRAAGVEQKARRVTVFCRPLFCLDAARCSVPPACSETGCCCRTNATQGATLLFEPSSCRLSLSMSLSVTTNGRYQTHVWLSCQLRCLSVRQFFATSLAHLPAFIFHPS